MPFKRHLHARETCVTIKAGSTGIWTLKNITKTEQLLMHTSDWSIEIKSTYCIYFKTFITSWNKDQSQFWHEMWCCRIVI